MRRHLLLGALLALPVALLALSSATPLLAVAAAAPAVLGMILLDRALVGRFGPDTAFWITILTTFGTPAFPLVAHEPDLRRSLALLLGALAVAVAPRSGAWSQARTGAAVVLALAGLACGGSFDGGPATFDVARALFGSRQGLLFWTPLLWAGFAGLAMDLRRERRLGSPLAGIGLMPLLFAPFYPDGGSARWDAVLPALALGFAVVWERLSAWSRTRPSVLVAAVVVLLGVPNLLFMEQYRDAPRRDDTVRFPDVAEENARRLADAVGSPVAWPANWIWSASTGLPAARWDRLSGVRLDPRRGVRIDIGDLEQDATFLLSGWSVRHACGPEVCREVEGRAEMAFPLDTPMDAELRLLAVGTGALRVSVNGDAPETLTLDGEAFVRALGRRSLHRGINRVVLEGSGGRALVDGLEIGGNPR